MIRIPFKMLAFIACIAAAATLIAPAPTDAGNPSRDCSERGVVKSKYRHFNAYMMQTYNYFEAHASDVVDKCVADLDANAGASPEILHSIAANCETYLGYIAMETEYYLCHIRYCAIQSAFPSCRKVFARSISFNNSMKKRVNNRQAELRDQIKEALAFALVADE
jgi:hypothetical protein